MYQIPEYKIQQINIVLNILNKYDPIGIITLVNKHEYSIEAIDIANRCNILSLDRLAKYIQEVFKFWFEIEVSDEKSLKIAEEIIIETRGSLSTNPRLKS